tara:strand:+ start:104 stop:475 length:372 start_codon:yes stop_codon:yes gene_type:complete
MRIMEGVEELGPYPSVVPEGLDNIPPSIPDGLRDSIVCNPCNGPMYWEGEVEHWSCPTCPNKKTLIKRVTSKERNEQLGLGEDRMFGDFTWGKFAIFVLVGWWVWDSYERYVYSRKAMKSRYR